MSSVCALCVCSFSLFTLVFTHTPAKTIPVRSWRYWISQWLSVIVHFLQCECRSLLATRSAKQQFSWQDYERTLRYAGSCAIYRFVIFAAKTPPSMSNPALISLAWMTAGRHLDYESKHFAGHLKILKLGCVCISLYHISCQKLRLKVSKHFKVRRRLRGDWALFQCTAWMWFCKFHYVIDSPKWPLQQYMPSSKISSDT